MGPNYLTSGNLTSVNSGFIYSEMVQLIRAITVQDFDTALTWDQAVQQQIVPNVSAHPASQLPRPGNYSKRLDQQRHASHVPAS